MVASVRLTGRNAWEWTARTFATRTRRWNADDCASHAHIASRAVRGGSYLPPSADATASNLSSLNPACRTLPSIRGPVSDFRIF